MCSVETDVFFVLTSLYSCNRLLDLLSNVPVCASRVIFLSITGIICVEKLTGVQNGHEWRLVCYNIFILLEKECFVDLRIMDDFLKLRYIVKGNAKFYSRYLKVLVFVYKDHFRSFF